MKKVILLMLLIASVCQLQAQETNIKKRSWVIGGSASFHTKGLFENPTNGYMRSIVNFNPYVGKELNEHWMIGADFLFANSLQIRDNSQSIDSQSSRHLGGGIFARYTVNPSNKLNLFVQPYANYTNRTQTSNNANSSIPINIFETGVKLGLLYNINERFRLKMDIGGTHFRRVSPTNSISYVNEINTNLGLSNIGFGIEVKF